ncbi:MAG: GNAT family N-acetyltransferase [Acidobacteriota bacterium]
MALILRQATDDEIESLIPILVLADNSVSAIRWSLENLSDTVYAVEEDGKTVAAVSVRWNSDPCEIVELAVAEEFQRRGIGRFLVETLTAEARKKAKEKLFVGTANSSIGNITFYQRCGFRMDHIRRDHFRYLKQPEFEYGIEVKDMIVFSLDPMAA